MSTQTKPRQRPRSRSAEAQMHERIRVRREAVRAARRRQRTRIALGALVLLGCAAAVGVVVASPLFAVTEVTVTGVGQARAHEALEVSGLRRGANMVLADLDEAEQAVEQLPWVEHASARRVPPSTLRIVVIPRQPVAVLALTDSSWLVDDDGVLIGGGDGAGLMTISAPGLALPPVGRPVDDPLVRGALTLYRDLPPALAARLEAVEAGAHGLRAHLRPLDGAPEAWVLFGDVDNLDAKARAAELVLSRIAQTPALSGELANALREVDVRAPLNPVLRPLQ